MYPKTHDDMRKLEIEQLDLQEYEAIPQIAYSQIVACLTKHQHSRNPHPCHDPSRSDLSLSTPKTPPKPEPNQLPASPDFVSFSVLIDISREIASLNLNFMPMAS